jgi:hypothetical protein
MRTRLSLVIFVLALAVSPAHAQAPGDQTPRLTISPRRPEPGRLARITVDHLDGEVSGLVGSMSGEPLHFTMDSGGIARAIGGVSIDVSDSTMAQVEVIYPSGRRDTLRTALHYPHRPPPNPGGRPARARRLRVDRRFTRTDAATEQRIADENTRAREAGRHAHETPQLWREPFGKPRASRITSTFGSGRVFNGRVGSSHGGVDFRGQKGEPVYAANRGVVAIVDSFFLAGNVIYIDHGGGVLTGYFHLSEQKVALGDTVAKGQEIGLVGATGRVTGPHLHWSARYGALAVDPLDLITVTGGTLSSGTAKKKKKSARE